MLFWLLVADHFGVHNDGQRTQWYDTKTSGDAIIILRITFVLVLLVVSDFKYLKFKQNMTLMYA